MTDDKQEERPRYYGIREWWNQLADRWDQTTPDPSKTMRTMAAHLRSGGGRLR